MVSFTYDASSFNPALFASRIEIGVRGKMLNAIRSASTELLGSFRKTTETWSAEHKPKFVAHPSLANRMITAIITTDPPPMDGGATHDTATSGDIWRWVDQGTEAHTISVGPDHKNLWLPSVWSPKTKPKTIASFPGSRGKQEKGPVSVRHPGIEAREFSATIAKESTEWFRNRMQGELNYWAKESGLSMSR